MKGEKDLRRLIQGMRARMNPGTYVFCTHSEAVAVPADELLMQFREEEGWTLILEKSIADRYGLAYHFEAAWITLQIHSDLEAIGLTAKIAQALTNVSISCNVVAGFYHDHLFVPQLQAQDALEALDRLSKTSK